MKFIVIEGGDQLGKTSLIKGLCEYFKFDNIVIRHFGKPPKTLKGIAAFGFQMTCFQKEAELYWRIRDFNKDEELGISDYFKYEYENILIWNRSHLGEYVYSQMFRKGDPKFLKEKLITYEQNWLVDITNPDKFYNDTYLITLSADPKFFLDKEDGNSFSQNLEQKTREIELFKEVHDFSTIKNKILVNVDKETELSTGTEWRMKGLNVFRTKEEILNEVINFIK